MEITLNYHVFGFPVKKKKKLSCVWFTRLEHMTKCESESNYVLITRIKDKSAQMGV